MLLLMDCRLRTLHASDVRGRRLDPRRLLDPGRVVGDALDLGARVVDDLDGRLIDGSRGIAWYLDAVYGRLINGSRWIARFLHSVYGRLVAPLSSCHGSFDHSWLHGRSRRLRWRRSLVSALGSRRSTYPRGFKPGNLRRRLVVAGSSLDVGVRVIGCGREHWFGPRWLRLPDAGRHLGSGRRRCDDGFLLLSYHYY